MKLPETHQQDGGLPLSTSDLLADLRSRIEACKKEETRLRETLAATAKTREDLEIKKVEVEHGITIGTVVISRDGVEHRVTSISASWGMPWLMGNPRKKDGTWGTAERHLYGDWKVSPANA